MGHTKLYSSIANNYPSFQETPTIQLNSYGWIESRKADDNAEHLWRVHDTLYDLSDFIKSHPGGPDWLRLTKGLDITEAFETHHMDIEMVTKVLTKFKVREAAQPRNYKFTFNENGFYKTFKRRVRDKLKSIDRKPETLSKIFIDGLLLVTLMAAILAARFQSILLAIITSLTLTWTVISAHNYFHRRDNFRMYYFNFSLMSFKEWRISHAMSHHMYPNSLYDLEITLFEPFLCWLPKTKNFLQRYGAWFYGPIFYALIFFDEFVKRVIFSIFGPANLIHKHDLIPFSVPFLMYIFNDVDMFTVLKLWLTIIMVASVIFAFIGLNAAHHSTETVHEGDALRTNMDWGIYTLDTVIDNSDITKSHFATLTHFGHHALHHLLPTLDHGILPQIYPILSETMTEFETELREFPWFFHISENFKQLARNTPKTDDSLTIMRRRRATKHTN